MALRITGMSSGLDTEAIVKELMSAQSLKKEKIEKAKTKLEWKQTAWSELNTKLVKLYNEQISKMQLSTAYKTKKATVSDSSKASVTAETNATNGSYTMSVNNIATSQYISSAKLSVTATSEKLVDLDSSLLNKEITIENGGEKTRFVVDSNTTIANFVSKLQGAGLNATYDLAQQRFFISSKESGVENAFSITTTALSDAEIAGKKAVRDAVGYDSMSSANKKIVDSAIQTLQSAKEGTEEYTAAWESLAKASYDTTTGIAKTAATAFVKADLYNKNYDTYYAEALESQKSDYYAEDGTVKESLQESYGKEFDKMTENEKEEAGVLDLSREEYIEWKAKKEYEAAVDSKAATETGKFVDKEITENEDVKLQIQEVTFSGKTAEEICQLDEKGRIQYFGKDTAAIVGFEGTEGLTEESVKTSIESVVRDYAGLTDRNETLAESALIGLGLTDIVMDENGVAKATGNVPADFAMIEASDSEIVLNGAKLTSSKATVSANGLKIELTGTTAPGETINFSVSNDVDAVYNSVKTALKEYNTLMAEMYKLYNAESSTGYEPLTSDEKEEMSDSDIELWETKIKDSLLRRDSTLGDLMQSMRTAMMSTVEYNGKKYALSSFGIMTSSSNYQEGGLLHIYGDTDDSTYASEEDKLRKALEEDPDAVVATLSDVFTNLRKVMADKMSAKAGVSSSLTFYNDISIKNDLSDYEDEIEEWEDRLADMEDSYYDKFTAMEVAMSKLQSQQSSLSSIMGG